jgi:hypothetical protein
MHTRRPKSETAYVIWPHHARCARANRSSSHARANGRQDRGGPWACACRPEGSRRCRCARESTPRSRRRDGTVSVGLRLPPALAWAGSAARTPPTPARSPARMTGRASAIFSTSPRPRRTPANHSKALTSALAISPARCSPLASSSSSTPPARPASAASSAA